VIGPCSIHDPVAARDYGGRLAELQGQYGDQLQVVMRTYFEKPRTTLGWKGFIFDPGLDGSDRLAEGLRQARELLLALGQEGLACATEFLDLTSMLYLGDLISWGPSVPAPPNPSSTASWPRPSPAPSVLKTAPMATSGSRSRRSLPAGPRTSIRSLPVTGGWHWCAVMATPMVT